MRRFIEWTIGFILLLCAVMPLASAAAAASDFGERARDMAEITNVRVSNGEKKIRIVVDASKPVTFKQMALSNPDRVVVDIPDAWIPPKVKRDTKIDSRFVGAIRVAQFNATTVRVVVENKVGRNNYKVFRLTGGTEPGRVVLDFGDIGPSTQQATIALPDVKKPAKTGAQTAPPVVKPSQPAPSTGKKPAAAKNETRHPSAAKPDQDTTKPAKSQETQSRHPAEKPDPAISQPTHEAASNPTDEEIDRITGLKGRVIVLDPGHGGNDSGAIGPTGVMEKTVTLRIGSEVARLLQNQGATVYMTRTTDTEVSPKGANASDIEELQARCDIANKNKADIFVSIHMDSFSDGAARGTTGYYYSLGSKQSRDLADKIRSNVIDELGTQSRGTQSCNFYVVKHTDMPATLVEVAFISNPTEEKLLDSEEGVKKAAQGIADGIADFFG
ncbi:MAG: N-acetylmuramoyl-L-alanine amidase [Selenomonadaceae bacterium]|nr:N-acetylmuramoyl-L-alanine amidase [Selenomonadaceae bacterium]MDY2685449.1 N-acetylmuramoyl-L-alanine amidase [Selenomonadaceae bacterium]